MHMQARRHDVVSTWVEDELVIYDSAGGAAHALDRVTALVWESCDGRTGIKAIAARLRADVDPKAGVADVDAALAKLREEGLLEEPALQPRVSRRHALR